MIMICLLLGIVPIVCGISFYTKLNAEKNVSLANLYLMGFIGMIALFEVISVPMTMYKCDFSFVVLIYSIALEIWAISSILIGYKKLLVILQQTKKLIQKADKRCFFIVAAIYIPIIVLALFTTYIYGDDKTYIAMVNDMLSTNKMYLTDVTYGTERVVGTAKYFLSAYWTWIAYLCKVSGLHPLILCKTILMFFFVPAGYAAQGVLGKWLFKDVMRKITIYMYFMIIVTIFGGFSNYTVTYRFYTWVWQSKAVLAIIILPFLFYYLNEMYARKTTIRDYIGLVVIVIASCASTLTGCGIVVGMVMLLALIYAIKDKKIGIIIKSGIACTPALILMYMYLNFKFFLRLVHFYG